MSKYTPETALAIKRDVQKAESTLQIVLREIQDKTDEIASIDIILNEKRSLAARFEDMVLNVFSGGYKKIEEKEKQIVILNNNISQLETARDILNAEILLRKEQIVEPAGAVLVQSLINQLEPILDKLLTNINKGQKDLEILEKKKIEFEKASKQLTTDIAKQEKRVSDAIFAAKQANENRQKTLQALTQEKQKLTIIRQRERDSGAMNRRLSKEYIAVYENTPRRKVKTK
jgi:DNA repair exonuclease SbcCD ATPase subunit